MKSRCVVAVVAAGGLGAAVTSLLGCGTAGDAGRPGTAGSSGGGAMGSGGATFPSGGAAPFGGTSASSGGSFAGTGGNPLPGAGGSFIGAGGAIPGSGGSGAAGGAPGAGGAPQSCASATAAPGETTGSILVGGAPRTYLLHVPPGYTGQTPVPLVVDFHPLFGSAASQRGGSGYAALSDSEGFIVVYPDGIDGAWNIGPCCTFSRTVDDLGFARALVDEVKRQACIDPKRVYATGFSMGGGMSHFLACNVADVFAAVAPSAFDLLIEAEEPCTPSRPISVISFRGTADFVVPYGGGASRPPNGLATTIHFRGAEATFAHWAALDGCTGSPVPGPGGCQTYSQCSAGVEVTLCTATGGGHVTGDARTGWNTLKRFTLP